MIHLIRRLRDSAREVRPSDWLLVAVEGLLVFIGILAAFQLQEWATDRREQRQVDRMTNALLGEARTAVALIWNHVDTWRSVLEDAEKVAATLSAGNCPTEEQMARLHMLDFYDTVDPPTGVHDELVANAGLSALDEGGGRLGLDFYYNQRNFYLNENENFVARHGSLSVRTIPPCVSPTTRTPSSQGRSNTTWSRYAPIPNFPTA